MTGKHGRARVRFDAKGRRPTSLAIDRRDAEAGGTFPVSDGETGCFVRADRYGDTTLSLPPNAPHFSIWALSDGRLVRLRYRDLARTWDFDEERKVLTVHVAVLILSRPGAVEVSVRTPWSGDLFVPIDRGIRSARSGTIAEMVGIDLPGRLVFAD